MSLRDALEEITNDFDIKNHPPLIHKINFTHKASIRIVNHPARENLERFNCVMYALDIVGCFEEPTRPFGQFYADTGFLKFLIDNKHSNQTIESVNALVVWSNQETIKHIGICTSPNRATSKWGIGHLYDHEFTEVPISYGESISFYEPIDPDLTLNLLNEYHRRGRR